MGTDKAAGEGRLPVWRMDRGGTVGACYGRDDKKRLVLREIETT